MTILPTSYLPSIEYFTHLLKEECTLELNEHYIKRSQRNRARIMTSSGVMELTVHLQHANRPKSPSRDMRIDYSKRWQHQHCEALRSAYKSSPYFDYYWEYLCPFYEREWKFLVDYNAEILSTLLKLLKLEERTPHISDSYIEPKEGLIDLRPKQREGSTFTAEPYIQVFSDRLPFEGNLSIVDLLFAEGPAAQGVLEANRI